MARLFFDCIFQLYGLPVAMVSNRNVTSTSAFWTELFRVIAKRNWLTAPLKYISVVSPVNIPPSGWIGYFGLIIVIILVITHPLMPHLFRLCMGNLPPHLLSYCPGSSHMDAVDTALQSQEELLYSLRQNLLTALQKMKSQYDAHHHDIQFEVGDKVCQLTIADRRHQMLLPKYYGPF